MFLLWLHCMRGTAKQRSVQGRGLHWHNLAVVVPGGHTHESRIGVQQRGGARQNRQRSQAPAPCRPTGLQVTRLHIWQIRQIRHASLRPDMWRGRLNRNPAGLAPVTVLLVRPGICLSRDTNIFSSSAGPHETVKQSAACLRDNEPRVHFETVLLDRPGVFESKDTQTLPVFRGARTRLCRD